MTTQHHLQEEPESRAVSLPVQPTTAGEAVSPQALVKQLGSKNPLEQAAAVEALEQMGPEAVEALLQVVQEESGKWQKNRRNIGISLKIAGVFMLCLIVFHLIRGIMLGHWAEPQDWGITLFTLFGVYGSAVAINQRFKDAAFLLSKLDDKRSVGPLTTLLEAQDKELRTEVETTLLRLLPHLQTSDADLLNDNQRQILGNALLKSENTELIKTILKTFEQVGDEKAVEVVEALEAGRGKIATPEIREAARACLLNLEARVARQQEARTLLRATQSPNTPEEVLLRPAADSGANDPQVLLRPVTDDRRPTTDHGGK